tara:strand:- start:1715 stop:2875 length:1161 start_codon:yes stop_codon:yes gene_type:complete
MALDVLRGAAQGLAGRALKKVAGNIRSGLLGTDRGGSDFSDFAGLNTFGNAFKTKHYTFPIDVESGRETGNHGHYIMFNINQQQPPSMVFRNPRNLIGAAEANTKKAQKQLGNVSQDRVFASGPPIGLTPAAKEKFEREKEARRIDSLINRSTSVGIQRRGTTRLDTHISLYMPPQVNVAYNTSYTDTEMGGTTAVVARAIQEGVRGASLEDIINKSADQIGEEIKQGAVAKLLGAADFIPGIEGSLEALNQLEGFVVAPQMELAFKGIAKRVFQYSFVMMPKSEEEAEQVQKIVQAFKANMLPDVAVGDVRRMTIPNTFDITYMYDNGENPNLHKISECVLENMQLSYGGDRYKAYEGGVPVVTNMTLNFKELDLITRADVLEGF